MKRYLARVYEFFVGRKREGGSGGVNIKEEFSVLMEVKEEIERQMRVRDAVYERTHRGDWLSNCLRLELERASSLSSVVSN